MSSYSKYPYASVIILLLLSYGFGAVTSPFLGKATPPGQETAAPSTQETSAGFDLFSFVSSSTGNEKADLSQFWDVWERLQGKYVEEKALNSQEMVYGAVKGMVSALGDPYTVFMTPEETEEFMTGLDGQLSGIGAELTVKNQNLVILSPIKGSPADKAGLLPADIVFKIDGELAAEMTVFGAITKIRGEKGTSVILTILRENVEDPIEVEIIRDVITIESVGYEMKDDNIAYISISQFTDHTRPEFNKVVTGLLLEKPKGTILDLRFNGGGYLDISVDILSEFIDGKKAVVKIKSRNGDDDKTIYVSGTARLKDIPLVVLVNEGSASASEIVAGAIQDHKRGMVIGKKTFGKGSVQEVMDDFADGSSLRLTIARWITPNGRSIDEEGIEPDRMVEITPEDMEAGKDPQLAAAVEYLKAL